MENRLSNVEKTHRNQIHIVLCLVATHRKISRGDMPPGSWAYSLSREFSSTLTNTQTDEKACSCLYLSGALFGTLCITWCLLLSSKYCWTGWANIIRPPAKPASGSSRRLFLLRILWVAPLPACSKAALCTGLLPDKSSRFASVVVQTVFWGPPGFSTQAKESSLALQEHLIQTQTLLLPYFSAAANDDETWWITLLIISCRWSATGNKFIFYFIL